MLACDGDASEIQCLFTEASRERNGKEGYRGEGKKTTSDTAQRHTRVQ